MIEILKRSIPTNVRKAIKLEIARRKAQNVHKQLVNDVAGKQKIFGIGHNKTGTTSLQKAMIDLDYIIGDQRQAELCDQ